MVTAIAALLAAGTAAAAVVETGGTVIHVKGGFVPHSLPRGRFAPTEFSGRISVGQKGGGRPPALEQVVVDFDRDGRFATAGLPTCPPQRVAERGTAAARIACKGSIVGSGHLEVMIELGLVEISETAPLTIFNGPRSRGRQTAVVHADLPFPASQTVVIVVPIERIRGPFGSRATVQVPPIAGGLGSLTGLDVRIGRRYRFHGGRRSYLSARCRGGSLEVNGLFTFTPGVIVEGQVEQPCTPL